MKTILITGSTDGIGKLAAAQLASEGHKVYLHGRSETKLEQALTEIRDASPDAQVGGYVADLSSLKAVRQLSQQVLTDLDKLDVLINNAGVYKSPISQSGDGFELRFAVNYLAPVLLTEALLPLLQRGKDARVINLSSAAQAPVSLQALSGKQTISVNEAYAQSKLALTMWSFHLAAELKDISVIALNPGSLLNTRMVQEAYGHHWSSADKGASIICDLAVMDESSQYDGRYFDNDQGRLNQAHADAYDPAKIAELLTATKAITAKF